MITAHEWLAGELGWWWASLADHLWQSTLFALLILVASLLLKRGRARLRHSLWLLASAKFIVPAGLVAFLMQRAGIDASWFFQPATGSQLRLLQGINEPISAITNSYELTVVASDVIWPNQFYYALTLIWLTGSLICLVVWAIQRRRFLHAINQGRRASQGREWEALQRGKEALSMHTGVELVISPHKTEPAVCRVWKPVVLLPQAIADHLDDAELEAIMLHELVHIQRRDNLVGSFQMMICALLWFHPLIWFISSKLFDERELACDEEVLKIRVPPEAYASSILKVVRFSLGWRVAGITGAGSGSNLRRRIENIMSTNNTKSSATAWHRLLAGTLVVSAIVLMLVAGLYTRVRNVNAAVQEMSTGSIAASADSMDSTSAADQRGSKANKAKLPPPPPPALPPLPATSKMPPVPPASPQNESAIPTAPATPASPTSPTAPSAATRSMPPPPPPVAPAPPTKEKIKSEKVKSKYKNKEKDSQDKVEKGGLIEAPPPVYPAEAKEKKVEGRVTVDIVIGEEGNVISAKPSSGPDLLQGAARDAAFKARFRPTLVNGKPAKVSGALSYNFVLDRN